MNRYLDQMRKYEDCVLLSIVNRDRFNYKPEEVQAAIEVLRERGVEFEFLSEDEVRKMNSFKARFKDVYNDIKEITPTFKDLIKDIAIFVAICVGIMRIFNISYDDIKNSMFPSHKSNLTPMSNPYMMTPRGNLENVNPVLKSNEVLPKDQTKSKGLIDLDNDYKLNLTPVDKDK